MNFTSYPYRVFPEAYISKGQKENHKEKKVMDYARSNYLIYII